MQTVILGSTGLKASVAGLGCGGHSRLGIEKHGIEHSRSIVRCAYDNGVNFFDTATVYGTQKAVGKGLEGINRDKYILSTKFPYNGKSPDELVKALDESLEELKTDYIDIYHLHGVKPEDYSWACESFVPVMQNAKNQGKIRFLGITEVFGTDTNHKMLSRSLRDDIFDVIMVGYSLLNPSAAREILPLAMEKKIAVLCMFAVRSALSNPEQLKKDIRRILASGQADPSLFESEQPLDFLTRNGAASSIMEAAYRYCRHSPGIDVVLTGTGNIEHLKENLISIQGTKLPEEVLLRLEKMFGNVDCVSGQ